MSSCGREQQINRFPTAGASSGSGSYFTDPEISPHSQVWQTPVRQDQRTGTSQASASSNRLWNLELQGTVSPARANEILGPSPTGPAGAWGGRCSASATPGVMDLPEPKTSVWMRSCPTQPIGKSGGEVRKERGWPAQIKIGFERYAQLFEDSYNSGARRHRNRNPSGQWDQAGCIERRRARCSVLSARKR